MTYIKPEVLKKVKQVDLLAYLLNYQPERLKKISHNTYCIRDHDSLHISNGLWNWQSMGIGGKSALDFLIKIDNYSFLEAANIIAENIKVKAPKYVPYSEKERDKKLQIPMRAKTDKNAIDYLLNRGISFNVIKHCIDHYLLYENEYTSPSTNKVFQNVAFIGWDKKTNRPRHIALRGINQDFKGDATGSDKHYSFCIESSNLDCDTVHVNEAPIDVLSQATLFELDNKEFNHEHILSLTGIYAPRNDTKEIKIPLALQQFLIDHPKIKNIIFHLDLDKVGRQATALIIEIMKLKLPEYTCYDDPPKYYKDTNDNLCMRLGIAKVKSRSKMDNKEYTR